MISRSFLRPSASIFKNGVCVFCQKSLLVRGIIIRTPYPRSADGRTRARPAEELVARQLGRKYVSKDELAKSGPRMPTAVLLNARKDGRIKISASVVKYIMREFELVMGNSSAAAQTLAEICSTLGYELDELTDVGTLYLSSRHPADQLLGRNLLLCASRAGSLSATIFLVHSAHRKKDLKAAELVKPMAHLKKAVQSKTTNVQALVLQGILYEEQKLYKEAASCFSEAIAVPHQDKDDSSLVKFLRWIGLDLDTKDPNLDKRRPQDLALDHVEAHIQLGMLYNEGKIGGAGAKNFENAADNYRIAALEYDDPSAYYTLARKYEKEYSYGWLLHMLKAAASGYGAAMEEIAELLGFPEEIVMSRVTDQRVRDWVLNNPVYWPSLKDYRPKSLLYSSGDPKKHRTMQRLRWALEWYEAAQPRAKEDNKLSLFASADLQWRMADLMQDMNMSLRVVRFWRAHALTHKRGLGMEKKVNAELKKHAEYEFRKMEQSPMHREAREILDYWTRNRPDMDEVWLMDFLKDIDDVPAGTWRPNKTKPTSKR